MGNQIKTGSADERMTEEKKQLINGCLRQMWACTGNTFCESHRDEYTHMVAITISTVDAMYDGCRSGADIQAHQDLHMLHKHKGPGGYLREVFLAAGMDAVIKTADSMRKDKAKDTIAKIINLFQIAHPPKQSEPEIGN